ncbi:MAG TPA: metal ABC transporter ATP-binding protein [Candidatus Scatavimonas merdigallinarum]|uniref:Metal ABC transporter ATP-binding protein n=1 Tax=Candidatus Scatavimonas merdigallinarum TaxID=2840914 RepID=A0A9D0ZG56_9FIRM|nr:metal ABC transporter ATP-binding protein [Candidatus Scatavimonas merdigallinarum]
MPLFTCRNVAMSYDGNVVLRNLNFTINQGDYLCIVGENGSGKTTLMKGMLGLLPVSCGAFQFSEGLVQKEVGYLPQQTGIQRDFPASVYEVVLSGCLNRKRALPFYTKKEKEIALQNMERLSVLDLKKKCYRELSGGQQQRVLLARALCATKKLLILDEPVTGLDPIATNELYELINRLNKHNGITVVMVSHDIVSAVEYADHILHLSNKAVFFGTTEEYLHSEMGSRFLLHNCHCEVCTHRQKTHNDRSHISST